MAGISRPRPVGGERAAKKHARRSLNTGSTRLDGHGGIAMKRTTAILAAIAFCAASSAYAMYSVTYAGTWPRSWPRELEPLRKQSRTLRGSIADRTFYEIPFTRREDFESAWPHILKVKSKGAPVIIVRGPDTSFGARINVGVRIHCPPPQSGNRTMPETPIDSTSVRERWL
jgi:hypothetical protein